MIFFINNEITNIITFCNKFQQNKTTIDFIFIFWKLFLLFINKNFYRSIIDNNNGKFYVIIVVIIKDRLNRKTIKFYSLLLFFIFYFFKWFIIIF